ncbi:MAG: ROK family protein [Proteobacteria bacterium]|jgi:fructokinase|nr:ROK family protein [Pseudomonadota bacterium]
MLIGIDLGGTKIEGILIDSQGTEIARQRRPTPKDDYSGTLSAITGLVDLLRTKSDSQTSVGIGAPGSIRLDGLLRNSNSTCLNGKPFAEDLAQQLGQSIRIENDANCFALSEASDGSAAEYETVFGVILGSGVGGGVVINKSLHQGRNHIAGEWGHNILHRDGSKCWCGHSGCVETYLSGPALISQWQGDNAPNDVPGLIALAKSGNQQAIRIMESFYENLGLALVNVVNILDPDAIVLGGGLSNIDTIYDRIPAIISKHVFSNDFTTPILKNQHGDSSGVRGAAWLWS